MSTQYDEPEGKSSFFDKIALFAAVVSLVCVLGAHFMDRLDKDGTLTAWGASHGAPGVDYSTTASIGKSTPRGVNPCGDR